MVAGASSEVKLQLRYSSHHTLDSRNAGKNYVDTLVRKHPGLSDLGL
jgi:hypothetical protein